MTVQLRKVFKLTIDNEEKEYSEDVLVSLRDTLNEMFPVDTGDKYGTRTRTLQRTNAWVEVSGGYQKGSVKVTHNMISRVKGQLNTENFKTPEQIGESIGVSYHTVTNVTRYLHDTKIVVKSRVNGKYGFRFRTIEIKNKPPQRDKISFVDIKDFEGIQENLDKEKETQRELRRLGHK